MFGLMVQITRKFHAMDLFFDEKARLDESNEHI
jgi:hypothetical protein